MLPMTDMMNLSGPPPQAILNQRWMWQILLVLLSLSFVLRFIGLDIPGALLSGLMHCFAVIMTRDGMQEISRYALVFAVLCGLNFFFDILPLLTELGGRVQSRTMPRSTTSSDGIKQTVYTVTVNTTPFFSVAEGLVYNVQSLGMALSPVAMALGVYLALSAHNEIQRMMPDFWDDGFEEAARPVLPRNSRPQAGSAADAQESRQPAGGNTFTQFQGQGYKLASTLPTGQP